MKIVNPIIKRIPEQIFTVPIEGKADVKVKIGDLVKVGDVLFEKQYKKILETYSLKKELGINKENPKEFLTRLNGEYVTKGEILAERLIRAGLVVKKIFATVDGILSYERLSQGYLDILSEHTIEDEVSMFNGRISDINLSKNITIKSRSYLLVSVTTISEKVEGKFVVIGNGDSVYTARDLESEYQDCIVFAGRFVFPTLVEEIIKRGAKLVIVWSMDYVDYEQLGGKVVVIGGFGQIPFDHMYSHTLKSLSNSYVLIEEKKIYFVDNSQILMNESKREILPSILVNDLVKIVDTDNYGALGRVVDTSSDDRHVTVLINSGERVLYPIEALNPID